MKKLIIISLALFLSGCSHIKTETKPNKVNFKFGQPVESTSQNINVNPFPTREEVIQRMEAAQKEKEAQSSTK